MSMSNAAKILHAFMSATGTTQSSDLATALDIPMRTIQRLKLEIACSTDGECANSANSATVGASESANHANHAIYGASPQTENAPTTPTVALSASRIHARVEETNLLTNLETTVVQESKILLRADAPKPKREAHGTRLPSDWTLPDDWRQWARVTFPQTTAERLAMETETFRDYWIASPGQRGRKADWGATWRNWCRKAFATAPIRPRAADGERQLSPWEAEKKAKHDRLRSMLGMVGGAA